MRDSKRQFHVTELCWMEQWFTNWSLSLCEMLAHNYYYPEKMCMLGSGGSILYSKGVNQIFT